MINFSQSMAIYRLAVAFKARFSKSNYVCMGFKIASMGILMLGYLGVNFVTRGTSTGFI